MPTSQTLKSAQTIASDSDDHNLGITQLHCGFQSLTRRWLFYTGSRPISEQRSQAAVKEEYNESVFIQQPSLSERLRSVCMFYVYINADQR